MVTLKNADIYAGNPGLLPPVLAALQDIGRQRVERGVGKLLRRLARAIDAQAADVEAERKRLLGVYAKRGDDGEPVEVKRNEDIADMDAYAADYQALLEETFEIEGIPESALASFSLLGATWASPIIVEDEGSEKKEAAPLPAGAGA